MVKALKSKGKGGVVHKDPIPATDLKKIYEDLTCVENPRTLQQKVFVDVVLHLARRGRDNLRSLEKTNFIIETHSEGNKYISKAVDELTKNHQNNDETPQGRLYEVRGKCFT